MEELIRGITVYFHRVATYDWKVILAQLLIIGLVVWWIMRFLRGTRGARLVKGAGLVLVAGYVGIRIVPENPEWRRLEFIYGRFLLFALAAAVIAFQPEIRRALIQIGQARFFRGTKGKVEAIVEPLVESAAYLSRNKTGAVVAVERSVGLGALALTGTVLDARLTSPLLNTIFYPGTALHDMGVIVIDGRIAAAGCQFPLAESEDVERSMGSRHRAALGLSQETDAVVIVVSEETGRVSLASDGQMHVGLEQEALREMLTGLLSPRKPRPRRRPRRQGEG